MRKGKHKRLGWTDKRRSTRRKSRGDKGVEEEEGGRDHGRRRRRRGYERLYKLITILIIKFSRLLLRDKQFTNQRLQKTLIYKQRMHETIEKQYAVQSWSSGSYSISKIIQIKCQIRYKRNDLSLKRNFFFFRLKGFVPESDALTPFHSCPAAGDANLIFSNSFYWKSKVATASWQPPKVS